MGGVVYTIIVINIQDLALVALSIPAMVLDHS